MRMRLLPLLALPLILAACARPTNAVENNAADTDANMALAPDQERAPPVAVDANAAAAAAARAAAEAPYGWVMCATQPPPQTAYSAPAMCPAPPPFVVKAVPRPPEPIRAVPVARPAVAIEASGNSSEQR